MKLNTNYNTVSHIERWAPDRIRTTSGMSRVAKYVIYPPHKHPTHVIIPELYRVDLHCVNGKVRSFGFKNAKIDSFLKCRVSGYSEGFIEIVENWPVAEKEN